MSKTIVVKYKNLELVVKPATVEKYRQGKLGFDNVVVIDEIFTNSYHFTVLSLEGNRITDVKVSLDKLQETD